MTEYFLIAEIKAVSGPGGFLSIISHTDFPERFLGLKEVYLDLLGQKKLLKVETVTPDKKFYQVKFKNFDTEDDCLPLLGKNLYVKRENLVPLEKDCYYIHDLIGSKVYRNSLYFGLLKDVVCMTANDVYVIEDSSGEEVLIPAVKDFILSVDIEKKEVVLCPGEGSLFLDDEN